MGKEYKVLMQYKETKDSVARFRVISLINDRGLRKEDSSLDSIFKNSEVLIQDFTDRDCFQEYMEGIKKGIIFEAKIKTIEERLIGIPVKKQDLIYKIEEDDSFRPVIYLYNSEWCNDDKNFCCELKQKTKFKLDKIGDFIPINKLKNLVYNKVSINDGQLKLESEKTMVEYSIDSLSDYIIQVDGNVYVATIKAYRKIEKNRNQVRTLEFWGNSELKEWFIRSVRIKSKEASIKNLIDSIENFEHIDEETYQYRISQCKKLFKQSFLKDEDIEFFNNKWKSDFEKLKKELLENEKKKIEEDVFKEKQSRLETINNELQTYKDEEITHKIAEQNKELVSIEEELAQKKQSLVQLELSLEKSQLELVALQSKIEESKVEKTSIEASRDLLLETSKDMILSSLNDCKNPNTSPCFTEKFFPNNKQARTFDDEDELYSLITAKFDKEIKKELVSPLEYKISIIPNISYAYALAYFSGNCYVRIITVEHEWYHFMDFEKAGLVEYWNNAIKNPDMNYILVLQNINMIPISSALQSLLDVINEVRFSIPGALEEGFPSNLRVCCTLLPSADEKDIGIHIDNFSYRLFNFVGEPNGTLPATVMDIMNETQKLKVSFKDIKTKSVDIKDNSGFERYSDY